MVTRELLEGISNMSLSDEKKLNMSPDEKKRGTYGEKGQGEYLTNAKKNSPTHKKAKAFKK